MVIIIGSGAGGAIIAMELAKSNIPVTIIEKGPYIKTKDAINYYDKSYENMDLLKTTCVGGSTIVSAGNGVRILEKEFKNIGIDLSNEYNQVEKLLNIHEMDDDHIGKGTQKFIDISKQYGFKTQKMPKFIRDSECKICGKCSFGCPQDAKWSSKDFIDIAIKNNAELLTNTEATKIIIENGQLKIGTTYIFKFSDGKFIFLGQPQVMAVAKEVSKTKQNSFLDAPEGYYTINIATTDGLDAANAYASENNLEGANTYSFGPEMKSAKVIYGIFESIDEAKAAISNLPAAVKANQPYVDKIIKHQKLYSKYN